ncbi:MAG: RdgB/HAM1 family non-canonical purine NTP pyrophosphatase [Kiritimatiellia bacterium]
MAATLLVATGNAHKLEEIRAILGSYAPNLLSLTNLPSYIEPTEDSQTFVGNALIKALAGLQASGLPTLADDSGLEVAALNGAPGVHSARYAGVHSDTAANNAKLLRELAGQHDRRARFRCAVVLALPGLAPQTFIGEVRGHILEAPAGAGGFGYDPLFVPEGFDRTFSELPPEVKNRLSHRAMAIKALRDSGALDRL